MRPRDTRPVPVGLAVAQFIRFYGYDTYQNPSWGTDDNIIPWRMFWFLYRAVPNVLALERINQTRAVAHGVALVFGDKKSRSRIDAASRAMIDEAFPRSEE